IEQRAERGGAGAHGRPLASVARRSNGSPRALPSRAMIALYGVPMSRAIRPLWMLEELGVPYENVKIDFTGGSRTPEYLKINPNGHIPALRDGDLTLWESLAINLYLARKYDRGLWPTTVEDEGRAFQWSIWAMTELEEPALTVIAHRALN